MKIGPKTTFSQVLTALVGKANAVVLTKNGHKYDGFVKSQGKDFVVLSSTLESSKIIPTAEIESIQPYGVSNPIKY